MAWAEQVGTPESCSLPPVGAVTLLGSGQGAQAYLVGAMSEAMSIRSPGLATAKNKGVLAGPLASLPVAPCPHPTRSGVAATSRQ